MAEKIFIILSIVVPLIIIFAVVSVFIRKRFGKKDKSPEIEKEDIDVLVKYLKAQKEAEEEKQKIKDLKNAEAKEKLENFKRTKDQLKTQLENQLSVKEWVPLKNILDKLDKGSVGIYVLYNETKDKYYVGQSKEVFARIKKHFEIEPIAQDFCSGDVIKVKILNATEMNADYRIDHVEKTGIELFEASTKGYNKTSGNM